MKKTIIFLSFILIICSIFADKLRQKKPHIVFIMADDMGWNDISLHGSNEIPTPNIDALGYNGLILLRHYTMHTCTPSRSALLTGNFPIRAGMQGFPMKAGEPRAIPLWMPTMSENLLTLGYKTHLVGKWHLGFENRSVTPNGRGFENHFGYWNGLTGYFNYYIQPMAGLGGVDLHHNYVTQWQHVGTYSTHLYTNVAEDIIRQHPKDEPLFLMMNHLAPHTGRNNSFLEVPNVDETNEKFNYIDDENRRLFAGVVTELDKSVGQVVKTLADEEMLDDTIIVFISDNGAQTVHQFGNSGSNYPFRGLKFTLWEGGVRNIAVIWSKLLAKKNAIHEDVFHIVDWMPTLFAAGGGDVADLGKIDGVSQWNTLAKDPNCVESRNDILLNIDEVGNTEGILSSDGNFKLIKGSHRNGTFDEFFGSSGLDPRIPPYDTSAVLTSDVNLAIARSTEQPTLTETMITQLRNRLEIQGKTNAKREILSCLSEYCLIDLVNDPTETEDVAESYPDIVKQLKVSIEQYRVDLVPQTNLPIDPNSNPNQCNGTWFNWLDPETKCVLN